MPAGYSTYKASSTRAQFVASRSPPPPTGSIYNSGPPLQNGRTSLDSSKCTALISIASHPRYSRTSKTNRRSTSPGQGASWTAERFKTDNGDNSDNSNNNAVWISYQRPEASSLRHLWLPSNPVDLPRCHPLQASRRRCHPSREEI